METVDNIVSGAIQWFISFVGNSLLPWAWENKAWLIAALPIVILITLAKWIRGG